MAAIQIAASRTGGSRKRVTAARLAKAVKSAMNRTRRLSMQLGVRLSSLMFDELQVVGVQARPIDVTAIELELLASFMLDLRQNRH